MMRLANQFYTEHIYDYKRKQYHISGMQVLKELKIDPDSVQPKAMPFFLKQFEGDEATAKMYYNFFHRRRVKAL